MKSKAWVPVVLIFTIATIVFLAFAFNNRQRLSEIYDEGVQLIEDGDYDGGKEILMSIENYNAYRDVSCILAKIDAIESEKEQSYLRAIDLIESENWQEAMSILTLLDGYEQSDILADYCKLQIQLIEG